MCAVESNNEPKL